MADTTIADALLLISKVSSSTEKRLSLLEKVIGKTVSSSKENASPAPRQVVEKAKPVIVTDFGKKAENDLSVLKDDDSKDAKREEEPGKGGMGFIKKLIGPALLVLGGLSALVTGLMSDGPLKGLLNILSKGGIIGGVKLFQKMAGKQLATFTGLFAKLIPTDLFAGVIKKAKGFLGSITKFLLKPFAKIAGKGGAKSLFGDIGKLFGKILKPLLKRIPGIGSLISWGFAISRFKSGDIVGGLIDVASGIATLFPGIGTGISIGLDVLNAFLDAKKGGKDEKVEPKGSGFKLSGFFGKIKDKIMNNFPIKNLMQMWDGAKMVFSGDIKGGLTEMAYAIPFMKPLANFLFSAREEVNEETGEVSSTTMFAKIKEVVMNNYPIKNLMQMWGGIKKVFSGDFKEGFTQMAYAIPFMKPLAEFLFSEKEEVNEETGTITKKESLFSAIKTGVVNKLKAFWKKAPRWLKWGAKKILPDNIISVLEAEGGAAPDDPTENEYEEATSNQSTSGGTRNAPVVANTSEAVNSNISSNDQTKLHLNIAKAHSKLIVDQTKMSGELLTTQIELLKENISLLREIADKTGVGANIITNNTTSVTNMNNKRNLRDLQEVYSY